MSQRQIAYRRLDEIEPALVNPKGHELAGIGASIARAGFVEPVILDERTGRLVGGHGRLEHLVGAHAAGGPAPDGIDVDPDGMWLLPVVVGWASKSDADAGALLVALNRLPEAGGWDDVGLAGLLEGLAADVAGLGLAGSGFDQTDLDGLLAGLVPPVAPPLADPDLVPEPAAEPVTKPGDLWLLGDHHRLLCGDARVAADFERVLNGHLPGAVVTDPPYGVGIGAKNRALDGIDRAGQVLTDLEGDQGIEEVEALWRASFAAIFEAIPKGCPYYINGPQGGDLGLLLLLLRDAGFAPRHILIWVKNRPSFSIGRLDYDYQHEPIVYGWKPGGPHPWYATEPCQSVFHVDRPAASPEHPTMKPVALLEQLIVNSTRPGEWVLDPFGGSGSTLIAAHQTGRRAAMLELAPEYVDVICRRFTRVTGIAAVHAETGQPHPG